MSIEALIKSITLLRMILSDAQGCLVYEHAKRIENTKLRK